MSGLWLRKRTWVGVAALALAVGVTALRLVPREPRIVLASPPPHDVVSRAADSEMEISPSLAVSRDGTLAIAWIATMGGRDDGGRYVAVRISAPNAGAGAGAGALGPLIRVAFASGSSRVSDPTIVPIGDDPHAFLVTWSISVPGQPGSVLSARVSGAVVQDAVLVAEHATRPRAVATPSGVVIVAYTSDSHGIALSTTRDGGAFTRRDVTGDALLTPEEIGACGDDHHAFVTQLDPKRGVVVTGVPLDPEGPAMTTEVSAPSEHLAEEAPSCFVDGQEVFVVYGTTEKARDDAESAIVDAFVFARSRDEGHSFWARVAYRPPSRLLHPAIAHASGSFTLLAVMGGGIGDAHASAGVIMLSADGRSQNGLTRTVIAPVTMVVSRDAAGYMGESLGVADVHGVTWAAVVDNASGESHVALARVL